MNLVDRLNSACIRYAVIGDYENLPESVGHDIDIWTDNINAFRKILFASIKQTNHHVLIDNQTANGCNVAFYRRDGEELTFMKIDVLKDTSYKSVISLVDADTISSNIQKYKNFFVVNKECETIMHFLYPLLEWGKIKKDIYKKDISCNVDSGVFVEKLEKNFGKAKSLQLIQFIKASDWDNISKNARKLRIICLLKSIVRISTYHNLWQMMKCSIKRFVNPSGKMIVFCGLDGAGKTTILDQLNKIFTDLLKSKKVYYGYWRPFVLPEIRELFGKKNSKMSITASPDRHHPQGTLGSLVKFVYYWFDYMLGSFKYGGIRRRGGIVMFDRHYIDMIVHPNRFSMSLSSCIMLWFYKFIPKPECTYFLYCTPEEIFERKHEFSASEIIQQTNSYMAIGKEIHSFAPIHTNSTIAIEIDEILSHLVIDEK